MKRTHALAFSLFAIVMALLPLWIAPHAAAEPSADPSQPRVDASQPRSASPQQNRSAPRSACTANVAETVRPAGPRVCDTPDVTVTMAITCPPVLPVHLIIAIDRSKSIADLTVSQILRDVQQSARDVIDAIDFEAHPDNKVGVISHGFRVTVETELTAQKSRALGAINGVKFLASDLGEDPGKAVDKARQMLEDDRGTGSPIEIILLYGDGCDPSVSGCEAAAKRASAQAEARGMAVMTRCYKESDRETCSTSYRQMVSQNNFYFESSSQVPTRVKEVANQGRSLKLTGLTLLEKLAPGLSYVAGSGRPPPVTNLQDVTFTFGELLPKQVVTASYRIRAVAEGTTALRINGPMSGINVVDSLNRVAGPIAVPTRDLTFGPCIVDTPTPTATTRPTDPPTPAATPTPTSTETPAATRTPSPTDTPVVTLTWTSTPRPTATATPQKHLAYLPILMRVVCKPGEVHTDVVLVIDASSSMTEQSGGVAKIDAAKAAARAFVGILQLGADQAAVVSFNSAARREAPLGRDRAALDRAIDGIATAAGTRIDLALGEAAATLEAGPLLPGNNRVVVLLTDGRTDAGTDVAARATAAAIKSGAYIYAIGLGDDVDAGFLQSIATSPATYLQAPTASQLAGIYAQIAGALPCPGGEFWGGGR